MSKELDRLKHLVVKMQVRYGEADPDVKQLVEDVNALEAYEAKERRTSHAKGTSQRRGRSARLAQGAGSLAL